MSLKNLVREDARMIMGVDSSTNSFAFSLYNGAPVKWGKVNFQGGDIYEKVIDCRDKMKFIKQEFQPDYLCIESAIMVKSQDVAIKMAMIVGVLISELALDARHVITVPPVSWQSHISNKAFTKDEKAALKIEFPGKTDNWYRNKTRQIRKQRTMDYFNNKFNLNIDDNDVGDALGIAHYGWNVLTSHA